MCIDFIDLDSTCLKDPYLSPNIGRLIDKPFSYKTLSFMDPFSCYNQIKSCRPSNTTFMSNHDNYYYNIIPFRLHNAYVTYQRLVGVVFLKKIGCNLEVKVNDMIVKTSYGKNIATNNKFHNKDFTSPNKNLRYHSKVCHVLLFL